MILAAVGDDLYNFFLLLHLVAVVVGFGGVVLAGFYAAQAKARTGVASLAVVESTSFVTWRVAEWFIYAVPLFGFGLIGLSDEAWDFGQTWIWLSLVLYLAGVAISHAVLRPAERRLRDLLAASAASNPEVAPRDVPELVAIDRRMGQVGGLLNVILIVVLALMIWKPGA